MSQCTQWTTLLSLGKCSCQFLTSFHHLEPVTAPSCFLYCLAMWNSQCLLDNVSKIKKKSTLLLFWFFLFVLSELCLSAFSHLNFVVLRRVELTSCRHFTWQGVFAYMHSSSPVQKRIASDIYLTLFCAVLCSQCLYFSYCYWELFSSTLMLFFDMCRYKSSIKLQWFGTMWRGNVKWTLSSCSNCSIFGLIFKAKRILLFWNNTSVKR